METSNEKKIRCGICIDMSVVGAMHYIPAKNEHDHDRKHKQSHTQAKRNVENGKAKPNDSLENFS